MEPVSISRPTRPRMSDAEAAQRIRNFLTEARKLADELTLRGYTVTAPHPYEFSAVKTTEISL